MQIGVTAFLVTYLAEGVGLGLVAAGTGLDYVVLDPIRTPADINPTTDPAWIHVPGAWWGALDPVWSKAVAIAG